MQQSEAGGSWVFLVNHLGGKGGFRSYDTWGVRRAEEVALEEYLDQLGSGDEAGVGPVTVALRIEIEAFVSLWQSVSPELDLDLNDARVGDALTVMAAELIKADDPPRGVLKAAFDWFGQKLETFADEAARAGGKSFGAAAGVGAGAFVTGNLPRLLDALARVSHLL